VYQRVGWIARESVHSGEALAELPASGYAPLRPGAERRVGATWHWLPSISDPTGYPPPHTVIVGQALNWLPDPGALHLLIDMTHLRWLLLRPAREWGGEPRRQEFLGALRASDALDRQWDIDGWTLVRLARGPQHPELFAAIAAGPRPGRTVLGTPLVALPSSAARGGLVVEASPSQVHPGSLAAIEVAVTNWGDATWPVVVAPGAPSTHAVRIAVRWLPRDIPEANTESRTYALWADLSAGETIRDTIRVIAPALPGTYDLELRLVQVEGATFPDPAGGPVRLAIEVSER
jgi:hypothetical protein